MNTIRILLGCIFFCVFGSLYSKTYEVSSPNGNLKMKVQVLNDVQYMLLKGNDTIIAFSPISMKLNHYPILGVAPQVMSVKRTSMNQQIQSPIYKKRHIDDNYKELTIQFKGSFSLQFRVYNEAAAYRFMTKFSEDIEVVDEQATFNFTKDEMAWAAYTNKPVYLDSIQPLVQGDFNTQFMTSFENVYETRPLTQLNSKHLIISPILVATNGGCKVNITEADLIDYPGMFFNNDWIHYQLQAVFAPVPQKVRIGGYHNLQEIVESREPYIAKTKGTRTFPWRVMVVAQEDKELLNSDVVYKLSSPSKIDDVSWIKPGKVAWDWWNDWNIEKVNFKSGINTQTYKYYIDFASDHHIEYVILDEGWAELGKNDLFKIIPEIDLKEIVDYGKSKNVGIILWAGYWAYRKDKERVSKYYSELGVKGFKIDFLDRDDQKMVQFMEETAQLNAKYKMLVDYHGTSKPAGLERTWPNVINFEGVNGLEQLKWQEIGYDQVKYDAEIPFIRMVAGPVDYTQGAMRNATKADYYPSFSNPMSQGTRVHQLATYVVFYSPLNMMSDSPSNYKKEPESTNFIADIPVIWDETYPLFGEVSEYVGMARRSGNVWYVGALTNWTSREVEIDFSFLKEGVYEASIFEDGINADRKATDYKHYSKEIVPTQKMKVKMQPGGGFVARIQPK